jgi:hypothetical protein
MPFYSVEGGVCFSAETQRLQFTRVATRAQCLKTQALAKIHSEEDLDQKLKIGQGIFVSCYDVC